MGSILLNRGVVRLRGGDEPTMVKCSIQGVNLWVYLVGTRTRRSLQIFTTMSCRTAIARTWLSLWKWPRNRAGRFWSLVYVELVYYVTHPDGREERLVHSFPMRYLFRFEAEHLLVRSGFEVAHVYAGFDKSLYGSTYPGELIFVARRVR